MQARSLHLLVLRARRRAWRLRQRLHLLPRNNLGYNRALWDMYSGNWDDPNFVRDKRGPGVPRPAEGDLQVLGDEWAKRDDVDEIVGSFILPFVSRESVVAEIGVGGGRIAVRVAPEVGRLLCFDVSRKMLRRAGEALSSVPNVELALLDRPRLPDSLRDQLDFIYSFDVFMHLDLHTIWRYIQEMSRTLRPGGRALVHVPDVTAPAGWDMFAGQDGYSIENFWFLCPEMVQALVAHTDLTVIQQSEPDPANLYLNRDFLAVLEKG